MGKAQRWGAAGSPGSEVFLGRATAIEEVQMSSRGHYAHGVRACVCMWVCVHAHTPMPPGNQDGHSTFDYFLVYFDSIQ